MFELAYPLADTIDIDGSTYDLDMSFDNILKVLDLISDQDFDDSEKAEIGLTMLIDDDLSSYSDSKRQDIFIDMIKSVLGKGNTAKEPVDLDGNPMPSNDKQERTYCVKQDAEYIFASFMSDYKIDLIEEQGRLNWYKFQALLAGLTDSSKFIRVIEIRTAELPSGKGTSKEREQMKNLKEQYALED